MRRSLFVFGMMTVFASVAYAARVYIKSERLQLSAARATSMNTVITGQLPACTNWRQGRINKECVRGSEVADLLPAGTCRTGFTLTTVLTIDCRYTPSTLADVPDNLTLETE